MENGFVSEFIKICGITVLSVAVIIIIKEIKGTFLWGIRAAGIIMIGAILAINFGEFNAELENVLNISGMTKYTSVMLKALGVSFLVKICSDICRDCGENNLAFGVESGGKLCVLAMSLPFIRDIIGYAKDFLKLGDM